MMIVNTMLFVHKLSPHKRRKRRKERKCINCSLFGPNGSIYSAFCRCKGGADQGCRHIGAALFELDDFLSNERIAVTSLPAYWNPKPTPECRPLPFLEVKLSHSNQLASKRYMTPYDNSWIDSFDPRPTRQRTDISVDEQINFAERLRKIDKHSGILDYLPLNKSIDNQKCTAGTPPCTKDLSHLTILSKVKVFLEENQRLSAENLPNHSAAFVAGLSTTPAQREAVSKLTAGQHTNDMWHQMRHWMVTGKKMKNLYTRQKTLEKKPNEDVTKTVENFLTPSKINNNHLPAIQYGIEVWY